MKIYEKKDYDVEGTKGYYATKVVEILERASDKLKKEAGEYRVSFLPAIKCANPMNNGTPFSTSHFKEICDKKEEIIRFELLLKQTYETLETKIIVVFTSDDLIEIKFKKEIENKLFDETLEKIKECLSGCTIKVIELEGRPPITLGKIEEKQEEINTNLIDFGVLGSCEFEDIECDDDFEEDDEYEEFINEILNDFRANKEKINNKIVFNMYEALEACAYPLWKFEAFGKIIDLDKLPKDFFEMTDSDKTNVVYKKFEYDEDNIIEKIKENVPFLNIDKLKNDIKICGVGIDKRFKEISISFDGICNFFVAMIVLEYDNDYKVKEFHVS